MSFEKAMQALEPRGILATQEGFKPKSTLWRDRWLLIFVWVVLVFIAANSWAVHGDTHATVSRIGEDKAWADLLILFHGILVLLLLVSPIAVILLSSLARLRTASTLLLSSFQSPIVYYGALSAFAVAQFSSLLSSGRLQASANLALTCLLAICVIWLIVRRPNIPIHSWVLFLTWLIALGITRVTLLRLLAIPEDPGWIVAFRSIFIGVIFAEVALPVILMSSKGRRRLALAISGIELARAWIYLGPFVLLLITMIALHLVSPSASPVRPGSRLLAIASVWLTGLLILQLTPNHLLGAKFLPPRLSFRWYWGVLGLIALIYVVTGGYISTHLPESINPDGLVYLSIARNFAEGNLVVRGYWSPLMSGLISPAISLGADPFRSQRVLAALIGLAWIFVGTLMASRYGLGRLARVALAIALGLLALRFAFVPIVPDMLGGVLILLYLYLVISERFTRHPYRYGLACGLIAGFAYYAKHYNFPFFLVHIVITGFLLVIHGRNLKNTALALTTSILAFLVVAAPLISANSSRYGQLTFSTSGGINYAHMGQTGGRHPCWAQMLCDQPRDVIFPWEDPIPQYYPDYGWNPFDSLGELQHLFVQWRESVLTWIDIAVAAVGPLIPLAFPLFGLATLIFWIDRKRRLLCGWTFITVLLYLSGYAGLHTVEPRFALPVLPLLVIGVFGFSEQIVGRIPSLLTGIRRYQHVLFLLVFFLVPILSMPIFGRVRGLLKETPDSGCMRPGAAAIAGYLEPPFAGSDETANYVAYYTGMRTYGVLRASTPASLAASALQDMNVRTYFASADSELASILPTEFEFQSISKVNICGIDYVVLRVPTS